MTNFPVKAVLSYAWDGQDNLWWVDIHFQALLGGSGLGFRKSLAHWQDSRSVPSPPTHPAAL